MLGNFFNFYNQTLVKNCNVLICEQGTTTPTLPNDAILDKQHIQSFSLKRRNTFVSTQVPSDNLNMSVIGWNDLPSATKTYLSTNGNTIRIYFCVENTYTTKPVYMVINDFNVDRKGYIANITCVSPIEVKMTKKLTDRIFGSLDDTPMSMPVSTKIEGLQLGALKEGKGIRYIYDTTIATEENRHTVEKIDFDNITTSGKYNFKNILEDYELISEEVGLKNVVVLGVEKQDEDELVKTIHCNRAWAQGEFGDIYRGIWNFDSQYVVTRVTFRAVNYDNEEITGNGRVVYYENGVVVYYDYGSRFSFLDFSIYGYRADYKAQSSNNTQSIYIPTIWNTSGNTSPLQTKYRSIYSHDIIEFDCRIDPSFEPLDKMYLSSFGHIGIEEMSIEYNGAFKGHIKARIIDRTLERLFAPIMDNLECYYDQEEGDVYWFFDITNPNDVTVELTFKASNSLISRVFILEAGETMPFECDPEILLETMRIYGLGGELIDSAFCWFSDPFGEYGDSENTIVVEAGTY